MTKVGFIKPDNQIIYLKYSDVFNFCQNICENHPKFADFKWQYQTFYPYFDFVLFELQYLFINPLYYQNTILVPQDNEAYLVPFTADYNQAINSDKHSFPFLTKVNDDCLQIKNESCFAIRDCMIDTNLKGIISKIGKSPYRSHIVTTNTILNQLLQLSLKTNKNYLKWLKKTNNKYDSVNYLINTMGFIRILSPDSYPIMELNSSLMNINQKLYIFNCQKLFNYLIQDINNNSSNLTNEYQKILKKDLR